MSQHVCGLRSRLAHLCVETGIRDELEFWTEDGASEAHRTQDEVSTSRCGHDACHFVSAVKTGVV